MNVSGTISGDSFPNQESFMYDSKGNYYFADAYNNIPLNGNQNVELGNKENKFARYILTEVRDND